MKRAAPEGGPLLRPRDPRPLRRGEDVLLERTLADFAAELTLELPLAPVEPLSINFARLEGAIGCVKVSSVVPLALSHAARRVARCGPAIFSLSSVVGTDEALDLPGLAAATRIWAYLEHPDELAAVEGPLRYTCEAAESAAGGRITISVYPPAVVPDGSVVVIREASIVGWPVALGASPGDRVTLGFSHARAAAGPVMAAAKARDIPSLLRSFDDGGSTEERDRVIPATVGVLVEVLIVCPRVLLVHALRSLRRLTPCHPTTLAERLDAAYPCSCPRAP
jgi:hypothetical protein